MRNLTMVLLAALALPLAAAPNFNGDYLTKYKGGVDTPHAKLASPYANGKPKVLFIVGKDIGEGQEVKEITQRADLDFDVFFCMMSNAIGGEGRYYSEAADVTPKEKERALLDKLSGGWDVIVLGSVQFNSLPPSCKYMLLRKFRKGTGIVAVRYRSDYALFAKGGKPSPEGVDYITGGMPFEGLFSWRTGWLNKMTGKGERPLVLRDPTAKTTIKTFPKGAPFERGMLDGLVECRDGGKARLVSIDDRVSRGYWNDQTCFFGDLACDDLTSLLAFRKELDIECGLFAKAIYWAAGMEPKVGLKGLPGQTVKLSAGEPSGLPLSLSTSADGLTLRWELFDKLGRAVCFGTPDKDFAIKLPALHAGGFFLKLQLLDQAGAVEDWGYVHLDVKGKTSFGPVAFDQEFFERGQDAKGSVAAPDNANVKVTLLDRWGRELSAGVFASKAGKAAFSLPIGGTRSMRVAAVAELLDPQGKVAAVATRDVYVPQLVKNDFLLALWPRLQNMDLLFITNRETFAGQLGINAEIGTGLDLTLVNMNEVWRQHWVGRNLPDVDDPEKRKAALDMVGASAREARKLSRRTHLVGDEVHVSTALSANATEPWRKWLAKDYQDDIGVLNSAWGSDYKSFAAIPVFAKDEVDSFKKESFPRYMDISRFAQINTGDFIKEVKDITAPLSPDTLAGLQYLSIFKNDAEYLAMNMDCLSSSSPADPSLRLMRDLGGENALHGGWTGGYFSQRPHVRKLLWTNLANGNNSLWLFIESGGEGILACDGRIAEHAQKVLPDYQAMANGLGTFVARAKRLDSSVAMLHDYRSVVGAEKLDKLSRYEESHKVFDRMLNDNGLQYRYLGGRALENGAAGKFKVLLLPFANALTAKQTDAVRAFVKGGGTVVADVAPGLMDGHGATVKDGLLADVFGVKQNFDGKTATGAVKSTLGLDLPFGIAVPNVVATTAQSHGTVGGTPALFENHYGKGTAWLLNFTPFSYSDLAEMSQEGQTAAAFAKIVGSKPLARLVDAQGSNICGIEVFNVFELDGRKLLVMLPAKKATGARLALDGRHHVHDTLTGMDLGLTDHIALDAVEKGCPLVFDLSLSRVEGIDARLSASPAKGRIVDVEVVLKGRDKGRNLVHVELRGPDGKKCPWAIGNEELRDGRATLQLPVAANERPGKYVLTVTDVLSGKAAQLEYTL